jgi:hypothetical protein
MAGFLHGLDTLDRVDVATSVATDRGFGLLPRSRLGRAGSTGQLSGLKYRGRIPPAQCNAWAPRWPCQISVNFLTDIVSAYDRARIPSAMCLQALPVPVASDR